MSGLTLIQAEDIFWSAFMKMLEYDPSNEADASKIRIAWPTLGMPGWNHEEEILFLRITEADDAFNRQRNITYEKSNLEFVLKRISQTRVWSVFLIAYGPSSYNYLVKIRDRLFSEEIKKIFRKDSLFFIPDISAPRRVPELFGGIWWERSDMEIRFNELVRYEDELIPYIESVEIKIDSQAPSGTNKNQDSAGSMSGTETTNTEMPSQVPESEKEDKEIARGEHFGIKIIKS